MKNIAIILFIFAISPLFGQNLGQIRTQEIILNSLDSVYAFGDAAGNNKPPLGDTSMNVLLIDADGFINRILRSEFLGGGTDTYAEIQIDGTPVSTNAPILDFDGTDFNLSESPTDDFDVTIQPERIQDIIGAMVTGNTETNITVTYEDGDGTLDFVVSGSAPVDTVSIQMVVEHWDVDVVDGTEVRFNIPQQYDKYEIIRVEAYVSTAGTTNSTTFEIENISAASVIDNTLAITSGSLSDTTTGLTHEVDAGEEISIEVTGNSTTEALGCRVVVVLSDQ